MTREEHIRRAEELLVESRVSYPTDYEIALAQVHATLALAIPPQADGNVSEVEIRPAVPR
ncbi:hypothetical protein ACQPZX_41315 [Actinoplanes sp. CA-142083]|uniref:hypothetical protein n=1 Tax=Actinoplanes sp. CA-142083 TaxID=3239903 RepID=UPI003D94C6D4